MKTKISALRPAERLCKGIFIAVAISCVGCTPNANSGSPPQSNNPATCTRAEAERMRDEISAVLYAGGTESYREQIQSMTEEELLQEVTNHSRMTNALEALSAGDLERACAQFRKLADDKLILLF